MSVVQTAYPNTHGFLVSGQIVDTINCDVDSMNLTGSYQLCRFGYGVHIDSAPRGVAIGGSREVVALLTVRPTPTPLLPCRWTMRATRTASLERANTLSSVLKSCTCRRPPATGGTIARGQLGSTAASHSQ